MASNDSLVIFFWIEPSEKQTLPIETNMIFVENAYHRIQ